MMREPYHSSSIRRIIVRCPNWVGDAVMCTPALRMLRDHYPSASITILAKPTIADLLKSHPSIDGVVVYDNRGKHRGISGKFLLIRQLRTEQYDLAVLFQNALEAAILMWLAAVPYRVGYPTDGRRFLLNCVIPLPPHVKTLHQVEYFRQLMAGLDDSHKHYAPTLNVLPGVDAEMKARLTGLGVQEGDIVIGMNPGSMYGGAKRWLPERFAETVDRLIESLLAQDTRAGSVHGVIVGAPGEEDLGQTIAEKMRHPPIVLSGKTTLQALMAVIKRCQLFITNDTGPMHIANAFGVPIVAIFGPTDDQTTSPFAQPYTIVRHPVECSPCLLRECPIDHRCMIHVTVEEVVRSAQKLLSSSNRPQVRSLS